MKNLQNKSLKNTGPTYEDTLYAKQAPHKITKPVERRCRECKTKLPETNYFHCEPCKARIDAEE
jgi:transcription initiation factor IIE alpha subunit